MWLSLKVFTMQLRWILLVAAIFLFYGAVIGKQGSVSQPERGQPTREDSSVTTESLVKKHRYPFEKHTVQTSDGYILTLHRIPHSARVNTSRPRPVAFLMHGLLCSSSDWIILGPNRALGYILSDAGYDVWLGNARGNRYSRKHVTRSPSSKCFWNFDWHEIGMRDLPAMIDFVRLHTGEDKIRYFGHSQGVTSFLLLNSLNSKLKKRINSAHLLAPPLFMDHMTSPFAKIGAPFLGQPNAFVELLESVEFLPNTKTMELFGNTACKDTLVLYRLCSNIFSLIGGFNPENLNNTMLPDIFGTFPAGASTNQVLHYLQSYNSGHFRQFDYGAARNLVKYGSMEPPDYPLRKVDVPVFFYYGSNDFLVGVPDVERLLREFPKRTLRRAHLVPHPKWNHFDFVWGMNAKELLYDTIMKDVESIK